MSKKYIIALIIGLFLTYFIPQIIVFGVGDFINNTFALVFSGPKREAIGGKILSPYAISTKTMLKMGLRSDLWGLQKFVIQEYKGPKTLVIINGITMGVCKPGNGIAGKGYWDKGFFVIVGRAVCGKVSTL